MKPNNRCYKCGRKFASVRSKVIDGKSRWLCGDCFSGKKAIVKERLPKPALIVQDSLKDIWDNDKDDIWDGF